MKRRQIMKIINGPAPMMVPGKEQTAISTLPTDLKAYCFKEPDEDSVEVEMYGEVVNSQPKDFWGVPIPGLYIALDTFLKDLDTYKQKKNITVRINSVGGDLYAGIAICNRLKELSGNVVTIVDGLAASAASVILQGGDTRRVFAGSQVMLHGASCFLCGSYNLQDMKRVTNTITGANKAALETYVQRSSKSKESIKSDMDRESWFTGQEAIDNGYADELAETDKQVTLEMSADKNMIISNGIPMSARGFANIPVGIPVAKMITPGSEPAVIEQPKNQTGGKEEMDMKELSEKYPELVKQIQEEATKSVQDSTQTGADANAIKDAAIAAERARIQAIEAIEPAIGNKDLIAKAKYGDNPQTAEQLALAAMQEQAKVGAKFLDEKAEDAKTSGAEDVAAVPNAGTLSPEEQATKDITDGASLIASAIKAQSGKGGTQ
ncbi:MAG: Clp protease ClpP [bacterium]|nr:Clp protease ClpP [bacterium]